MLGLLVVTALWCVFLLGFAWFCAELAGADGTGADVSVLRASTCCCKLLSMDGTRDPLSSADLDPLQTGSSHLLARIPALPAQKLGLCCKHESQIHNLHSLPSPWFSPSPFLTSPYRRPISYEGVLRDTSSQSEEHPAPGGWNGLSPQNLEEASAPPSSYQPLLSAKSTTIFKWFLLPY